MAKNDGVPLPSALAGIVETRPVKIDRALFYLVGGALAELADKETFEQTGTLTVEQAKAAISDMLWNFYHGSVDMTPIGGIVEYGGQFPLPAEVEDAGWLPCIGFHYPIVDYPELYAVIGTTFNTGGEPLGRFRVPNMLDFSTMGAGSIVGLGGTIGEQFHALTASENGQHSHGITDPGHTHAAPRSGGGAGSSPNLQAGTVAAAWLTGSAATGITINNSGTGEPHNNMQPTMGINKIIRAF